MRHPIINQLILVKRTFVLLVPMLAVHSLRRCSSAPTDIIDGVEHGSNTPVKLGTSFTSFRRQSISMTRVLKTGTLRKKSSWNGKWQERFFALDEEGRLVYFKHGNEELRFDQASAGISVTGDLIVTTITSAGDRHTFQLRIPPNQDHSGKTFVLCAETLEDACQWIEHIERVRRQVLFVNFPDNVRHW